MEISTEGVLAIARLEGVALGPYRDSRGIWTCGIGHTKSAGLPDPAQAPRMDSRNWTEAQMNRAIAGALGLLRRDLAHFSARVRQAVKVPLQQHQFDALVSFDFNTGGILRAKLTAQINQGNFSGEGFMGWLRPSDIIPRRRAEQALFLTGNYHAGLAQVPIYDTTREGGLQYRCTIAAATLLALTKSAGAEGSPAVGQGAMAAFLRFLQRIMGGRK